jgi:hypothetical protein
MQNFSMNLTKGVFKVGVVLVTVAALMGATGQVASAAPVPAATASAPSTVAQLVPER